MSKKQMSQAIRRIPVDFQNADSLGRVRLNCIDTIEDLAVQGIQLTNGLQLLLYQEELEAKGSVTYSEEERLWVAAIDWKAIKGAHPGFKP